MVSKETIAELIATYGNTPKDSGKPEVQVAVLTAKILDLSQHLLVHKKDNHTRRGLIALVAKRRKMLDYLAKNEIVRYRAIISALSLRK